MINQTALTGRKRFAWCTAAAVMLAVVLAFGSEVGNVRAMQPPQVFTVAQSPAGPASVQPADTITYAIDFTANATFGVSDPFITGTLSAGLSVVAFNGPYAGICSGLNTSAFSCHLPPISANITIVQLVVTAAVANVADNFVVDLGLSNFKAKDSALDSSPVSPSGADPGALTVMNEAITVTNTPSLAGMFEAGLVSFTASLANSGSGASGAYNSVMTLSGGSVDNVVCPGGAPGSGTGTTVATCSNNTSLAASGSTQMVVTAKAADGGSGTLTANVSLAPGAGNVTGIPSGIRYVPPAAATVPISELTIAGAGPFSTGTSASVCTTNNPATPGLIAGLVSAANPLTVADYQLVGSGGAAPSAVASITCPGGQQGVAFTSTSAGTVNVTARTNAPGSGSAIAGNSNTVAVTFSAAPVTNPVPVLSGIAPSSAGAGGPSFPLVVAGSNFVAGSIVRWNSADLVTTFGTSTSLSAVVPAASIATAGTAAVTVFNPLPGGGTSAGQTFTMNSAPTITSLTPPSAPAGSAAFQLVIAGTNFVPSSVVRWDGTDLVTTYGTGVAISAQVPAARVASANSASVTVFNPGTGGGLSNALAFTATTFSTKLGFSTQPTNGSAGTVLASQPIVAVQDSAGATVTTDNATVVTIALTGSGTLTCTGGLTKTAVSGLATFAGCAISAAGTGDLLVATSVPVLTSASSAAFNITAQAPTTSAQLVVAAPSAGTNVARSRLRFSVGSGTLATPATVTLIVKRKSDNKYWNNTAGAWQTTLIENAATGSTANWSLAITGDARRNFAGTTVIVEARAVVAGVTYVSAVIPEIAIR